MADSHSIHPENARRLPTANLKAVVSEREISLDAPGLPLVLVFHAQDTAQDAVTVNKAVRGVHPDPGRILVASVIDLRSFPSMFRGMVESELQKAYHNAARRLPEGADPRDHVVLLPDWDGAVHDALEIENTNAQAAVVVSDALGNVILQAQEEGLGQLAVAALEKI